MTLSVLAQDGSLPPSTTAMGSPSEPIPPQQGAATNSSSEADAFRLSALGGNIEAARKLGLLYYNGTTVKRDYTESFKWLGKAATGGDEEAEDKVGNMYRNGWGVTIDYGQALNWYQKAAGQGYAPAQYHLGCIYLSGQGVEKNRPLADVWFRKALPGLRKAADGGDAESEDKLGQMYANGFGVAQDYSQAMTWLQKAADQGYASSQFGVGALYSNGWGVAKDDTSALIWLRKAAEQGDPGGEWGLGLMYANGRGVPQDYSIARSWYQKAAEQDEAGAECGLGLMYANAQGVPQDYASALTWLTKAANHGNVDAEYALGMLYSNGQGVAQDYPTALNWYQKAADQNSAFAERRLGDMYRNGQGTPVDAEKAREWYQKAADQQPAIEPFGGLSWDDGLLDVITKLKGLSGLQALELHTYSTEFFGHTAPSLFQVSTVSELAALVQKCAALSQEVYIGSQGYEETNISSNAFNVEASPINIAGVSFSLTARLDTSFGFVIAHPEKAVPCETGPGAKTGLGLVLHQVELAAEGDNVQEHIKELLRLIESKYPSGDFTGDMNRGGYNAFGKDGTAVSISWDSSDARIVYSHTFDAWDAIYKKHLSDLDDKQAAQAPDHKNDL